MPSRESRPPISTPRPIATIASSTPCCARSTRSRPSFSGNTTLILRTDAAPVSDSGRWTRQGAGTLPHKRARSRNGERGRTGTTEPEGPGRRRRSCPSALCSCGVRAGARMGRFQLPPGAAGQPRARPAIRHGGARSGTRRLLLALPQPFEHVIMLPSTDRQIEFKMAPFSPQRIRTTRRQLSSASVKPRGRMRACC